MRVIDESGEDYLYSVDRFVAVELPRQAERSVVRHIKESTLWANHAMQTTRSRPLTRISGLTEVGQVGRFEFPGCSRLSSAA